MQKSWLNKEEHELRGTCSVPGQTPAIARQKMTFTIIPSILSTRAKRMAEFVCKGIRRRWCINESAAGRRGHHLCRPRHLPRGPAAGPKSAKSATCQDRARKEKSRAARVPREKPRSGAPKIDGSAGDF